VQDTCARMEENVLTKSTLTVVIVLLSGLASTVMKMWMNVLTILVKMGQPAQTNREGKILRWPFRKKFYRVISSLSFLIDTPVSVSMALKVQIVKRMLTIAHQGHVCTVGSATTELQVSIASVLQAGLVFIATCTMLVPPTLAMLRLFVTPAFLMDLTLAVALKATQALTAIKMSMSV